MRVVYYVSGHGYGHAVRAALVVRELVARGAEVRIRSDAAAEAFAPLPAGVEVEGDAGGHGIDVGVVQRSSVEVDRPATLQALASFWANLGAAEAREAALIAEWGADIVVADIAPLGVLAAIAAGRPRVVVANFSWDFIYAAWAAEFPEAQRFAELNAAVYRRVDLLLRTPLSGGLESFRRSAAVPLIVRRATRGREELRAELGLPRDRIAVLVTFGGFGAPPLVAPSDLPPGRFVSFGFQDLGWDRTSYRRVDRSRFTHPDLVCAADLVLGKPGYGTVSECAAHATPMLWTRRDHFAEEPLLVAGLVAHVGGAEMAKEDLARGRWRAGVERALATGPRLGPLPLGGATVAADAVLRLASGSA